MNLQGYISQWSSLYNTFIANAFEQDDELDAEIIPLKDHIEWFIEKLEEFYPKEPLSFTIDNDLDPTYRDLFNKLDLLFNNKSTDSDWRAFFVSDGFLDVQFELCFIHSLWAYLYSTGKIVKLPIKFLLPLSLSYGLFASYHVPDARFKDAVLFLLAVQSPLSQKNLFFHLFGQKGQPSRITHDIYLSLLSTYYAIVDRDKKNIHYKKILPHLHYPIYPVIKIPREDEVIRLVSYFIKKFKPLNNVVSTQLIENFNFPTSLTSSSFNGLYHPLYDAIIGTGFSIEKLETKHDLKHDFFLSLLPQVLSEKAEESIVDRFFTHSYLKKNVLDADFIAELHYQLSQKITVSYYFWERLLNFFLDLLLQRKTDGKLSYAIQRIDALCNFLTNDELYANFIHRYLPNDDDKNSDADLEQSTRNISIQWSDEEKENWLREHVFFNNLNYDGATPMRTIYRTILLELLQSFVTKTAYAYDMETDGRYIISYRKDEVLVIFHYRTIGENSLMTQFSENLTYSATHYANVLNDVVNMYLTRYFTLNTEKAQFTQLIEQVNRALKG